ncbi:hypothetical protein MESS4_130002 [Mesorhizobium sp. STM 4661]|nr:hypothetical protein MESS4_130002 [Mesorhizobium sp. STM 4661]
MSFEREDCSQCSTVFAGPGEMESPAEAVLEAVWIKLVDQQFRRCFSKASRKRVLA